VFFVKIKAAVPAGVAALLYAANISIYIHSSCFVATSSISKVCSSFQVKILKLISKSYAND
jgi:hypothetical protein